MKRKNIKKKDKFLDHSLHLQQTTWKNLGVSVDNNNYVIPLNKKESTKFDCKVFAFVNLARCCS